MHATFSGDSPEDLALPYVALLQRILTQPPRAVVFIDAAELVNYETGFRLRCTQAHKTAGARIEVLHVLVGSRLIALGFQAVAIILRNMVGHTSRAAFDAELANAIAARREAP
jgi:hypothetical protein